MNKNIEIYKEIYKPYRYTFKGSATIIESTQGTFVIKESKSDLNKLFNYLKSRSFNNIPDIVDSSRNNVCVFKYLEDISYPKEQRANDLINLIASLHYKTSYYKDVTEDNFKSVYDNIKSNINYYNELYDKYFDEFFKLVYHSPSEYLFLRNYSKIKANLMFCEQELDNYYEIVKNEKKIRVSVIHNNLSLDHYIKNETDYLISWDKFRVDIPILDLVNFYKKEYFNLNFDNLLKNYLSTYKLNDGEMKLFFILISLPLEIKFNDDELNNCINLREILDYIYKTENLIRPYYSKNKEEK